MVAPLMAALYALPECGVGGPLHIVTDDNNVDDGSLEFCRGELAAHWSVTGNPRAGEIRRMSAQILDALAPLTVYRRHKAILLARQWALR